MAQSAPAVAVVFLLFGMGCLEDPRPVPEIGSKRGASTAVTWTSVNSNTSATGNDITKTGSSGDWDAGGISAEEIAERGFIQFTTAEENKGKAAGLDHTDTNDTPGDIDFGFSLNNDGTLLVKEAGTNRWTGTYDPGDVLRIEVKAGKVRYYKNDLAIPVWTSATTPTFPLHADAALRQQNATINDMVIETALTTLHVGTQKRKLPDGLTYCGSNDVVVIPGSALIVAEVDANGVITPQALSNFINESTGNIEDAVENWATINEISYSTTETLILDMEAPHPRDLGDVGGVPDWPDCDDSPTYSDAQKNDIVEAWVRRIDVVRDTFQDAQLGMYGTLNPHGLGNSPDSYLCRREALIEAGKATNRWGQGTPIPAGGLYDDLDYLVPVLYVRYGCSLDSSHPGCDFANVTAYFNKIEAYTQQGIDDSLLLTEHSPEALPLLPLLTVHVDNCMNGCTLFDEWMVRDLQLTATDDSMASLQLTLGRQLELLGASDVADAVLWIGNGDNYEVITDMSDPCYPGGESLCVAGANNDRNNPPWTIEDYTCNL